MRLEQALAHLGHSLEITQDGARIFLTCWTCDEDLLTWAKPVEVHPDQTDIFSFMESLT